jgi:tetratricopeptide (TPR) repeat protein
MAGCTPAGPRALSRGRKDLDAGDYAGAVAQFRIATGLFTTNAAIWNYYGVALQHASQPDDAVNAYQRALELDRDLLEARLNLGTLYLEQNKPDAAKTEFTACTLRRPNDPAGWLKLGAAQLKLGEIVPAERSFSTVYHLDTNNVEALNGFGLARVQRGKPREAAQFFAAALLVRPDYPAALLNLAAVNQEYLHDNRAALENYHAYLALTPRPANWDEVNALATALEANPAPIIAMEPVATVETKPNPPAATETKPQPKTASVASAHPTTTPKTQAGAKPATANSTASRPITTVPTQVVQIGPETQIVTSPNAAASESPTPAATPRSGHRISSSQNQNYAASSEYAATGITPLPGSPGEFLAPTAPAAAERKPAPIIIIPPAPVEFPRYDYLSPRRPPAGDRRAAGGAFAQAREAEQDGRLSQALQNYRQAVALDPSWFEAQYNAGVLAHRLQNYSAALASYETALALEPGSVDARYNFALALKAAGYVPDAANELKKILAANPDEVRAHLALANLCAQSLHDPAQAREHYLQVLSLDSRNPQATDIRFWLKANPQ